MKLSTDKIEEAKELLQQNGYKVEFDDYISVEEATKLFLNQGWAVIETKRYGFEDDQRMQKAYEHLVDNHQFTLLAPWDLDQLSTCAGKIKKAPVLTLIKKDGAD